MARAPAAMAWPPVSKKNEAKKSLAAKARIPRFMVVPFLEMFRIQGEKRAGLNGKPPTENTGACGNADPMNMGVAARMVMKTQSNRDFNAACT